MEIALSDSICRDLLGSGRVDGGASVHEGMDQMSEKKTTEIMNEIYELLSPLQSEERHRVIQAALTLLGETQAAVSSLMRAQAGSTDAGGDWAAALPVRARTWVKQHGISLDELQQVFHLDNGRAEFIAGEIPGKNKKEKTLNAYLFCGLASLFSTGDGNFDDKSARALCVRLGCYDQANHSVTLKDKGNEFAGSKDTGWSLTAPGLKRLAALMKEMTKG